MIKVYTVKEVAEEFSCSPQSIRELLKQEKLRGFKLGNRWRIKEEDLDAYIEKSISEGE